MLIIKSLSDFREAISGKDEIREAKIGAEEVSFCYMIASSNTFETPEARECRGIVFNEDTGQVVARPLHKFFNVGEREETQVNNIDWSKVARVMDKLDGSMIHTATTTSGLRLKSKKSFDSDVAGAAEKWMRGREGANVLRFCEHMLSMNKTAIFEWTAPDARIVLYYPNAELRLLHVRNNETGEYSSYEQLSAWGEEYGVTLVDECLDFYYFDAVRDKICFDVHAMVAAAETRENIEGWIVQFEDGDMVKVKTKWYLERHRAMTFLRERDIVELILSEGIDDLKSLLVTEGVDISEIVRIENAVVEQLRNIRHDVESFVKEEGHRDRKDFAIHFGKLCSENGMFGLLMTRYLGKEPDYKEWYRKHMLKETWSLRQLNLFPSVAEGE